MFGFGSKKEEINKQHNFEKNALSYIDQENRKIVKGIVPSFSEEVYKQVLNDVGVSASDTLNDLPKEEVVPLIKKIMSFIPYNEEKSQELLGSILILVMLRASLITEKGKDNLKDSNVIDLLIDLFKSIVSEIETIHKNHF